ncbi:putative ATP-dependent RNA helicase [Metallosphaera sp. J1]|uniref:helicase-related protein n=1 Tax=Metallosphaera javensis (ex Hofmann et al. 2022) TaxID=99938 RepID=UPI001EDE509C|nr:helicase-related protein [Metallosphaera javensis (ex Hofmann et al. 2022)]MCG3109219.1 putative ATP-dependent RNA helicase [Metallosphaera javensis (ex Hofmann et al. 2022)]
MVLDCKNRDVIDNKSLKMEECLKDALSSSTKLWAVSGYFNVSGLARLLNELSRLKEVKLVLGRMASMDPQPVLNNGSYHREVDLEEELNSSRLTYSCFNLVNQVLNLLRKDSFQVRTMRDVITHAKAYITDNVAIVGSSNLTRAGLSDNLELNTILYQPAMRGIIQEWFNTVWESSQDSKQDIISLIESSKFGRPLTPYEMYMKMLYEYYKDRLVQDEVRRELRDLTEFQRDGVKMALSIIQRYGGVMIADSTGLGKTYIAMTLIEELYGKYGRKVLVVAPKNVIQNVWERDAVRQLTVKVDTVNMERLGRSDFDVTGYIDYDIIVIDESHNFRNGSTNRYSNLLKIISAKKGKIVILLTATPINNGVMDLYYQLNLIAAGDDAFFHRAGIPSLRNFFINAEKERTLAEGLKSVQRVLDEIMVRRSRQFIKEHYNEFTLNGKRLEFPKRELKKVEYSLSDILGENFYREVYRLIDNLHLVPYNIENYNKLRDEEEKERFENMVYLQRLILLKRFESSIEAFRKSLTDLRDLLRGSRSMIEKGQVPDKSAIRKAFREFGDEEIEESDVIRMIYNEMKVNPQRLTDDYDRERMIADIDEDVKRLEDVLSRLEKIKSDRDQKALALYKLLEDERALEVEGKKVLIFTQYVDTARYLKEFLRSRYPSKEVEVLVGGDRDVDKIIRRFSPKSNKSQESHPIDILVSTDVISEGQNLQDCNYVVNYDLPWNPVRLVQRVGRVDRIGSEWKVVHVRAFMPERELEELLGLYSRLLEKIDTISKTIGTDETILGEEADPREFNAIMRNIRRIGKDDTLLDEIEKESDTYYVDTPYEVLMRNIREEGLARWRNIPLGKRSWKESDRPGVIFMFKVRDGEGNEEPILLYYDVKGRRFELENNVMAIFDMARSSPDEGGIVTTDNLDVRIIQSLEEMARKRVESLLNFLETRPPEESRKSVKLELMNLLVELGSEGRIDTNKDHDVYDVLDKANLSPWEDDLRAILNAYKRSQDPERLLESLRKLIDDYYLADKVRRKSGNAMREIVPVGYMILGRREDFKSLELRPWDSGTCEPIVNNGNLTFR